MSIATVNPATGKQEKIYAPLTAHELDAKLAQAAAAFQHWRKTSFAERARLMKAVAADLKATAAEYGRLATIEMGKPITQAVGEVEKCAWVCEYFADSAEKHLAPEHIKTENSNSYVRFDPLGVILAVMPWNFPYWQVFRAAAPALMAGNVMVMKHSSNVPQCAAMIERIFEKAGFPPGVFTTLLVEGRETNKVTADERIAAVTLTGSEAAGIQVAETAGRNLKKTVLELGGSDPFIVLEDADIVHVAGIACLARTQNSGQSCIAAKRFIVVEKVADAFTKAFVNHMERLKVGDPLHKDTQVGPLARKDLVTELDRQVQESVKKGAKLLTGGKAVDGPGHYYQPTVLTNVKKGMPAYGEELFGPAASVIVVKDAEEAIHVANDTRFGLGSSIWTKNIQKAEEMAAKIEAGAVFINDFVKSDPRMPFGGIKKSGYGRELGEYGIKEFVNIKTVIIK